MERNALRAATIAALGTAAVGLLVSWIAMRMGWTSRISWVAAGVVPLLAGLLVYRSETAKHN